MLYRPESFEPLTNRPWDESWVRDAIAGIVGDVDDALLGQELLWPAEEWDAWQAATPLKNLYCGAAGVVWALDELRRRGHAETRLDLPDLALRTLELFRAAPDYTGGIELPEPPESALLVGETGILLVAWRLAPAAELADALHARVRANLQNESNELMWGTAGTMLAAGAMLAWTGEERWREAWEESASALLSQRDGEGLWRQRLHGKEYRFLGPAHGLVGNVQALLPLLDAERRRRLERQTVALLQRTAVVEDGLANWPPGVGEGLVGRDGDIRVQWCHGAPGIVIAAIGYLEEELLLAGAELTWRAGPLGKGPGLCHGTAGNGHALLKVFERTGDERWLERARRFAVHALEQAERRRAQRGVGRYSLWTGDPGVALYAADCLAGRSFFPILDVRSGS